MYRRQRTNEKPATANNAFNCAKMAWIAGLGRTQGRGAAWELPGPRVSVRGPLRERDELLESLAPSPGCINGGGKGRKASQTVF